MDELTESLSAFLDNIEAFAADLTLRFDQALDRQGHQITCRTCTHAEPGCCYQKILIPFFEGLPIARYLKKNGLDTPEFRERLRVAGEEMEGTSRTEWFRERRRPCVFLQNGRCSIYPLRPLACSTYVVITPAERCQPDSENNEVGFVDNGLDDMLMKRQIEVHRAIKLKESRYRLLMGALPRVVLIALEAWDSDNYINHITRQPWPTTESVGSTWLDGENVFGEQLVQIRRSKGSP